MRGFVCFVGWLKGGVVMEWRRWSGMVREEMGRVWGEGDRECGRLL